MTTSTAASSSQTRRPVWRRARSCCEKKFMSYLTADDSTERDFDRLALFSRILQHQQLGMGKAKGAGKNVVREGLNFGVVFHHRVVVGLACKSDLVFGASELFRELHHG